MTKPNTKSQPKQEWENTCVQISHLLIKELVDEPFMLTGVEDNFFGQGPAIINQCFYASVVYLKDCILVFHNEAGGMCPIEKDYFHKKYSSLDSVGISFNDLFDSLKSKINT